VIHFWHAAYKFIHCGKAMIVLSLGLWVLYGLTCVGAGEKIHYALVVPPSIDSRKSLLKARDDGQQLTNPDKEDPYQDEISGGSIERSRVLSGVGPSEAADRQFDWDESCADEKQRKKFITAFRVMQELTTSASEKLQALKDKLPNPPGTTINKENRKYISKTDFAYTQMFRARDNNIDDAKGSFDKLTRNAKNFPDRSATGDGALRFICAANNQVVKGDGSPVCG
jgi:hypothetical protein